jgi:hypothetical protein
MFAIIRCSGAQCRLGVARKQAHPATVFNGHYSFKNLTKKSVIVRYQRLKSQDFLNARAARTCQRTGMI